MWSHEFGLMSSFANKLGLAFQQSFIEAIFFFENARNSVQNLLHNKYPVAFPYGTSGVDITDLFVYMFTGKSVGKLKYNCTESLELQVCSQSHIKDTVQFRNIYIDANNNKTKKCSHCGKDNSRTYEYNSPQCFWRIEFTQNSQDIEISKPITLKSDAGSVILPDCGAIYYTGNHFVSRIISPTREVWYHDGIETKCQCIREGHLIDFCECSIKYHGSKRCVGVVYSV